MYNPRYIFVFLLASVLSLPACSSSSSGTSNQQETGRSIFPRPLPNVPSSIKEADEQAFYMLQHYWDKFDFGNKEILDKPEAFEECLANYFGLLTSLKLEQVKEPALYPLKNSLDSVLQVELKLYRKYFYEANSPMNNNDIYEAVLNWTLSTPRTSKEQKIEAELLLALISKNKVGTKATDFIYQEADGSKHHLDHLLAPYSLLAFVKSDCATCEAFVEQLKGNDELREELKRLKLDIVLIYLDAEMGQEELSELPSWIIAGTDCQNVILNKQLYDIKATPTFYLLKRGGEVLLKETFPDEVLEYLKKNI